MAAMAFFPESAAPLAQRVARTLLAEIKAGTLTADRWEVDGPHWHADANARLRYFTHVRPSGTIVRLRFHNGGDNQRLTAHQMMVLRDDTVVVEATGPDAEALVKAVRELVQPRIQALRGEVEREFGD